MFPIQIPFRKLTLRAIPIPHADKSNFGGRLVKSMLVYLSKKVSRYEVILLYADTLPST